MFFIESLYLIFSKITPIVGGIIGFGSIIAIHESGHFLFCKLFGIHTPTFSIGFGPEIFKKRLWSTNFRLALIPLGGYVEMAGNAEIGQGEQAFANVADETSYDTKPFWQKFLVGFGGILFNFIFAYIVFCGLFVIGTSDKQAIIISSIVANSPAEEAGLKSGDAIIAINSTSLVDETGLIENAAEKLLDVIEKHPDKEVTLTILTQDAHYAAKKVPVTLGSKIKNGVNCGSLGTGLRSPLPRLPFLQALKAGIAYTNQNITMTIESIKKIFTQGTLQGVGGPLMIISATTSSAQHGIIPLFIFLGLMSINLALLNLLPIGALDGGQLLFVCIEAIIRRKLPLIVKNTINIASWLLFISLAIVLSYRDIMSLFGKHIEFLSAKIISLF
jgi:regulator of sigma E protease